MCSPAAAGYKCVCKERAARKSSGTSPSQICLESLEWVRSGFTHTQHRGRMGHQTQPSWSTGQRIKISIRGLGQPLERRDVFPSGHINKTVTDWQIVISAMQPIRRSDQGAPGEQRSHPARHFAIPLTFPDPIYSSGPALRIKIP